MSRRVDFGMALPTRRPLSAAKIAALRRAKDAQRGREPRGEQNGAAKLTEAQVRKIRDLHADGERPSVLALRFAVERTTIWHILTRRTWRHV
jgi:hypothetical protein